MYRSKIFKSEKRLLELSSICVISSCVAKTNFRKLDHVLQECRHNGVRQTSIYEAIIQCYLFCGFPPVIESMKIYKKHFPAKVPQQKRKTHMQLIKAGENNCKLIYGKNYKKLIDNMTDLSTDMRDWMITEGYGKVFSRKGLTLFEREFVNVSVLTARYFGNQLHSHLRGCLHTGATKDEIVYILEKITGIAGKSNVDKCRELLAKL